MAKFGSGIRPELGLQDWSPVARGGAMYGQSVGQGFANLGAGVGSAISDMKARQQQEKEQKKQQKDMIAAAQKTMEAFKAMSPEPKDGDAPSRAGILGSPVRTSANTQQRQYIRSMEQLTESLKNEEIPLSQRAAMAQQITGITEKLIVSGLQTELQKAQTAKIMQEIEQDRAMQPLRQEAAALNIQSAKTQAKFDQFKLENMDDEWQMKVAEHSDKMGLNQLERKKLGYEIDQLTGENSQDIWNMPFERMDSKMKAAYIFMNDMDMPKEQAIAAAYGMEGPSVQDTMKALENTLVSGHKFSTLWAFTSDSNFKEKPSKDGQTIELSAGRGNNSKSITIPKESYDLFKNMRDTYREQMKQSFQPAQKEIPTVTSQAEYDALEKGDEYFDASGIKHRKS